MCFDDYVWRAHLDLLTAVLSSQFQFQTTYLWSFTDSILSVRKSAKKLRQYNVFDYYHKKVSRGPGPWLGSRVHFVQFLFDLAKGHTYGPFLAGHLRVNHWFLVHSSIVGCLNRVKHHILLNEPPCSPRFSSSHVVAPGLCSVLGQTLVVPWQPFGGCSWLTYGLVDLWLSNLMLTLLLFVEVLFFKKYGICLTRLELFQC